MPWMVIYPLTEGFSYDANGADYKGTGWIVSNLIDTVAKRGSLQVGIGPEAMGKFHPSAIEQLKDSGRWLKVNGEGIYATRPRNGSLLGRRRRHPFWPHQGQPVHLRFCAEVAWNFIYFEVGKAKAGSRIKMLGVQEALAGATIRAAV